MSLTFLFNSIGLLRSNEEGLTEKWEVKNWSLEARSSVRARAFIATIFIVIRRVEVTQARRGKKGERGRGEVGRERGLARDGLVCKIRYLRGDTRDTCFIFMREERRVLAYSKHKLLSAG